MKESLEQEAWKKTPEGAQDRKEWEQFFLNRGISAAVATKTAEGRLPQGTCADDPVFTHFVLLEGNAPDRDRSLKKWAQSFGLTHAREIEEDLPATKRSTTLEDGELVFDEEHLYKKYWACQWALDTLWQWHFHPMGPTMRQADPPEWVRIKFVEQRPYPRTGRLPTVIVNESGWNPGAEEPTDFRERIHKAVDAFLDAYIENAAESMGIVKTPRKRREHFDWLALFQVTPTTHQEIAAQYNVEAQAVSDGIRGAAKTIVYLRKPMFRNDFR